MAEITASAVKELRELSGAGMMDCKAALTETKGDIQAGVDWLRKKGLSKAAKKSGRVAAEGLVGIVVDGKKGVVVEVNSETDFVARNDHFQGLVKLIAQTALHNGADVEKLKTVKAGSSTIDEAVASAIATIGENMTFRRAAEISVSEGEVAQYMHGAISEGLGKIGVLVALESKGGNKDELNRIGRMVAMHIAAANPLAVESKGIDAQTIERERGILAEKARASGKPDNVVEKIVDSGLKSFYKEVSLIDQPFVHDPSKTVAQALKETEGKAGGPIAIKGFVRFALGEGVEKQEQDFAAEVAAAGGKA
ncbi:MAG: translation elongation factor Ts [Xanthobacteraceae bacterium]|nr:translation elongation factor Ts [Xanthobacteraceae bacterium]